MRNRSFSIRLARFFLLVAFVAHAFLASAGAHYEADSSHLIDGTKEHTHQSGLRFSEFDNDYVHPAMSASELELRDDSVHENGCSVCLSRHIHISNICIGEKPVNHSPYTVATKIETDNIRREVVSFDTALYDYPPPAFRLVSSRSPPLL